MGDSGVVELEGGDCIAMSTVRTFHRWRLSSKLAVLRKSDIAGGRGLCVGIVVG